MICQVSSIKTSNKQPELTPKATTERRTNKTQSQQKEIYKNRAEINEREMKKTIKRINETKSWSLLKINKIDKPLDRVIKKKREVGPNQ